MLPRGNSEQHEENNAYDSTRQVATENRFAALPYR